MVVYETEEQIRGLTPDLRRLATLDFFGVIVTAPAGPAILFRGFSPRGRAFQRILLQVPPTAH